MLIECPRCACEGCADPEAEGIEARVVFSSPGCATVMVGIDDPDGDICLPAVGIGGVGRSDTEDDVVSVETVGGTDTSCDVRVAVCVTVSLAADAALFTEGCGGTDCAETELRGSRAGTLGDGGATGA